MHLELHTDSRLDVRRGALHDHYPDPTTPLYDLSDRALSLGDGEIADLVESLSTSSALAQSWAARRSAVTAEGNSAMLQPVRV